MSFRLSGMECCTSGSYVRATIVFKSTCPEEVSLCVGDVLKLLDTTRKDHFWYYGQKLVDGIKGQFPESFVENIDVPSIKLDERVVFAVESHSPMVGADFLEFVKGDIIILEKMLDDCWAYGKLGRKSGAFPIKSTHKIAVNQNIEMKFAHMQVVKAVLPMYAQQDMELSFVVDDYIFILQYIDHAWAKGQVDGRTGIFPLSFTEHVETVPKKHPSVSTEIAKVRKKSSFHAVSEESQRKAIIKTDFHAKTEFELSVSSGTEVTVIKEINEKWCKVKYKNKYGFIPISSVSSEYCTDTTASTSVTKERKEEAIFNQPIPSALDKSVCLEDETSSEETVPFLNQVSSPLYHCYKANEAPFVKIRSDTELTNDSTLKQSDTVVSSCPQSHILFGSTTCCSTKSEAQNLQPTNSNSSHMASMPSKQANLHGKNVSSTQKKKIEHIRTEIEEYSRVKKEIEVLYNASFDGKERQNLAQNKEFIVAKLKRLQKELEDLIYVTDNIYESVDVYQQNHEIPDPRPPPTPPPIENLEEIKTRRLKQRKHVLDELVSTEKDFLHGIEITINDIMKPLSHQELPLDVRIDVLFGNIEDIRDFSSNLLLSLEALNKEMHQAPNVGAIFIKHIPQMKEVYKMYCRNHDDATVMLEKIEEDPELCHALETCLNCVKLKVNAFDLGSFLIKPVQRVLKYPLLLHELLKLTDVDDITNNHNDLVQAQKMMQDVANSINEDKRRKDLVRKYRKGSTETLSGKISRLSIHSMKKKSARISLRIGHAAGLANPDTQDEKFNVASKCFKDMELAVKDFLRNLENFSSRCKEWLCSEQCLCEDLLELFATDASKTLVRLTTSFQKITEQIFCSFCDKLQLRVLSPLSSLLVRFKGPQAIIEKRFDKLLDFENCQNKESESPEKIQMAKNVYEALNQQLLDELPQLCELSKHLLHLCSAIFVELYIELQENVEKEMRTILNEVMPEEQTLPLGNYNLMQDCKAKYQSKHSQAVENVAKYSIVPAAFGAITTSLNRLSSGSFQKAKDVKTSVLPHSQTLEQRNHVMNAFPSKNIYVATQEWQPNTSVDVPCNIGDVVAVIKRQDPMGNNTKWFVDNGVSQGFLPSNILSQHSKLNMEDDLPTTAESGSSLSKSFEVVSKSNKAISIDPCSDEDEMLDDLEYGTVTHKGHYRVEYDFFARSTLELSVNAGDILTLIVAEDLEGNPEWWLMSNSAGKQGYVPFNYMTKAEYL